MEQHQDQEMNAFIRALVGRRPAGTDDQDQGEQEHDRAEVVDMNTRIRRAAGYGDDAA